MFYRDNWLSWTYDGGAEYGPKLHPTADFKFILRNVITRPIKSYYEELLENARALTEKFTGPFDLLFSGGLDSEVILRVYKDLKIPLNVYVCKYENDYNYIEFNQALDICRNIGVTPTIINFNLQQFYENDAYDIWTKVYAVSSGWLPHLKMTEYLDNIPILGSGEPYFRRTNKDLTTKYPWVFELDEQSHHSAVYHRTIGRTVITDWYEYSPEVIISYMKLPYVRELLNDSVPGKLSTNSSKALIHKAFWPDIKNRESLIGFEGKDPTLNEFDVQPFMIEFEKKYMIDLSGQLPRAMAPAKTEIWTEEELTSLIYSK
jgi:hypothetical protein